MYDRFSGSLWSQALGEGIVGTHAGENLTRIPFDLAYWKCIEKSGAGYKNTTTTASQDTSLEQWSNTTIHELIVHEMVYTATLLSSALKLISCNS